jgi:hypothetical protein
MIDPKTIRKVYAKQLEMCLAKYPRLGLVAPESGNEYIPKTMKRPGSLGLMRLLPAFVAVRCGCCLLGGLKRHPEVFDGVLWVPHDETSRKHLDEARTVAEAAGVGFVTFECIDEVWKAEDGMCEERRV